MEYKKRENRAEKNIWSNNGKELFKINYDNQTIKLSETIK